MRKIININGENEDISNFSLDNMQKIVKGYIQVVSMVEKSTKKIHNLVLNEDGIMQCRPNIPLTRLIFDNFSLRIQNQTLYGTGIICEANDIE